MVSCERKSLCLTCRYPNQRCSHTLAAVPMPLIDPPDSPASRHVRGMTGSDPVVGFVDPDGCGEDYKGGDENRLASGL